MPFEQDALLGVDVEQVAPDPLEPPAPTQHTRWFPSAVTAVVATAFVGVCVATSRHVLASQRPLGDVQAFIEKTSMAVHPLPAAYQPSGFGAAAQPDGAGPAGVPPAEVPPAAPGGPPAEGAAGLPGAVPLPVDAAEPLVDEKYAHCPATGGDCRKDKCCKDPGTMCFAKNKDWAECRAECEEGMHLTDPDSSPWSCDPFGDKTPGEVKTCAKDGEDCSKSECCHEPGQQCYAKNEYWAACKPACEPGPDLTADEKDSWTCTPIGERSPGAAPWVAAECAHDGEDCRDKGCCADAGHQCFKKNDGWGMCKAECQPGHKDNEWEDPWSCEAMGPVTPASGNAEVVKGKVAAWVAEECKSEGENCIESKCCKSVGWQCFTKNDFWAQCLPDACPPPAAPARLLQALPAAAAPAAPVAPAAAAVPDTPPPATPDPNAWECSAVGPRGWGLAVKGWPSLYCISLYMPSSYEGSLINAQLTLGAGIFSCDGYDVIASEEVTCGESKDGILVKTQTIAKIAVGMSQDGTAGNAKLFMAFWDKIIAGKRFRDYDWTIKADPDAVVIAWRLRDKMRAHVGENVYVVNCNKVPDSPNFPMMFGSVEIFSSAAMIAYADGSWQCGQQLPWDLWGEDYYMTHCLDMLGVGRLNDFTVVGDNVCTGADCGDGDKGSYHPFKTADDWTACWNQAAR